MLLRVPPWGARGSRHGVISRASPRVASADALYCEPKAFEGAVLDDCLLSILRACGRKAACWRRERRDASLIECYRSEKYGSEKLFHLQFTQQFLNLLVYEA